MKNTLLHYYTKTEKPRYSKNEKKTKNYTNELVLQRKVGI